MNTSTHSSINATQKRQVTLIVRDHLFVLPENKRYERSADKEILCRKTEIAAALDQSANDILFTRMTDVAITDRPDVIVTAQNWKSFEYRGINLYAACIYSICMKLGVFISDVTLDNPKHFEAAQSFYFQAACFVDYALELFDIHNVQKCIIVQGYFVDGAILRQIATSRNIPMLALELTFHSGKMIWDNVSGICVNKNLAHNIYWREEDKISTEAASQSVTRYLTDIRSVKRSNHVAPENRLKRDNNRKQVLFLGQVYTDSSLLFGLHDFHNPIDVVQRLISWCMENDTDLIIKLHPKENGGMNMFNEPLDQLTYRHLQEAGCLPSTRTDDSHPRIIIDHENLYDTYQLIRDADLCVTINSQAGLEALLLNKNVLLCGQSSYGGLGFTWDAINTSMLNAGLAYFLNQHGDMRKPDKVKRFFYILMEHYFIERTETVWWNLCLGKDADPKIITGRLPEDRPIVFWGTGSMSQALGKWLGRDPDYYVDNQAANWGQRIGTAMVKSPDWLRETQEMPFVILATSDQTAVAAQLEELGMAPMRDFI